MGVTSTCGLNNPGAAQFMVKGLEPVLSFLRADTVPVPEGDGTCWQRLSRNL